MALRMRAVACVSLIALASAKGAHADAVSGATPPAAAGEATLGEIVVTARRRAESLQDVPQTVNAVTADELGKLQIKKFEDVQNVVAGLSLSKDPTGAQAVALRGVNFDLFTGSQPSVALYLNDVPVAANVLFGGVFDIGQVEVLKGPQGTTRGIAAPSGAITVTTRKPDLSDFGGYVDVTATDQHARNVQGALNLPIVRDVLALRLAGQLDQTDADGVRSIHNALRPRETTGYERASLSFEPSDTLNANVTYTHMDQSRLSFQQVSGPGQGVAADPAIAPEQRASVTDGAVQQHAHFDVVTAQLDSRILGQHLSYVGSYQRSPDTTKVDQDTGDVLPGVPIWQYGRGLRQQTTQEIRLASDPRPGRFFDYTVGVFYNWDHSTATYINPGPLLPGAFGDPAQGVDLSAYNPGYQIPLFINVDQAVQETSLFGSVTFHLGSRTELTGGVRHLWSIFNADTSIVTGDGKVALPAAIFGGSCPAGGTYPGSCDLTVAGGMNVGPAPFRASEQPNIYNVSLSHHLTRDVLLYANTGTSYRPPVASVGLQGDIVAASDPLLGNLSFHPAERSRAFEFGVKATFLDGRGRVNASVFRQRFDNLVIYVPGISYLTSASNPASSTVFNMSASVDARVEGFDIDTAFQITPDWNVSLQASYADGKTQGSQAPCNLTNGAGAPVYNTGGVISFCPGGSSSRLPLWNASLQTEYTRPLGDGVDGFLRGLVTYYPQNKNRAEPDFTVDSYSLINLYAGLRSHDGAWEASVFARNTFNTKRATDIQGQQLNVNTSLGTAFQSLIRPSGYYATTFTARREVGVNLRYAFGSR